MAPKDVMILNGPTPETSIEVPVIFVDGRWQVDQRAFGEPLFAVCEPYLDDPTTPGGDAMLARAREVPLPDGAELGELLRTAER